MTSEYEKFSSKAYKTAGPAPRPVQPAIFAREQYPSRRYPRQGGEHVSPVKPGLKTIVHRAIQEEVDIATMKKETEATKKPWNIPFKWKSAANKAGKQRDVVCVLFLNIKGEIEQPMLLPIYGNMILLRNKIYEVDPRAFWIYRQGAKMYKFLIIKEIDRRPVSNLDLDEIRRRGDATDSDEFLIKMALRAQQTQTVKAGMNKWVAILIGIVVLGVLIYFFAKGG
jgi:hypothetical protein